MRKKIENEKSEEGRLETNNETRRKAEIRLRRQRVRKREKSAELVTGGQRRALKENVQSKISKERKIE